MSKLNRKVIVSWATSGAARTPSMSHGLPLVHSNIERQSLENAQVGASILQLHARDPLDSHLPQTQLRSITWRGHCLGHRRNHHHRQTFSLQ